MATKYDIVALLPMKANSERVKGKNFREFAGKPLFKWILDTLLNVKEIDCVIINTDARDILASHGLTETSRIQIRDRKPEICGEMVSMNKILEDDVNAVQSNCYLMTHTTNPLLSAESISNAIRTYKNGLKQEKDSLFSVTRFQTRFYKVSGEPVNHNPTKLVRTQDLEPWLEENSNLYIFSKDSFKKTGARIGNAPILFETPTIESQDIDNTVDWRTAEILALTGMLARSHSK